MNKKIINLEQEELLVTITGSRAVTDSNIERLKDHINEVQELVTAMELHYGNDSDVDFDLLKMFQNVKEARDLGEIEDSLVEKAEQLIQQAEEVLADSAKLAIIKKAERETSSDTLSKKENKVYLEFVTIVMDLWLIIDDENLEEISLDENQSDLDEDYEMLSEVISNSDDQEYITKEETPSVSSFSMSEEDELDELTSELEKI